MGSFSALRVYHVTFLIINVMLGVNALHDQDALMASLGFLGASLGAVLLAFAPASFWQSRRQCPQRGCAQTDGNPCAYAACPNRAPQAVA